MFPGTASESALLYLVLGPEAFAHAGTALTPSCHMLDSLICWLLPDVASASPAASSLALGIYLYQAVAC